MCKRVYVCSHNTPFCLAAGVSLCLCVHRGKVVTLMAAVQRGPSKPSRSDSRSGERGDQERQGAGEDREAETDKRLRKQVGKVGLKGRGRLKEREVTF